MPSTDIAEDHDSFIMPIPAWYTRLPSKCTSERRAFDRKHDLALSGLTSPAT